MLSEKLQKLNKPVIGLAFGLAFPLIAFLIYYASKSPSGESLILFIERLKGLSAFIPTLSLCVLPNLFLYFGFKKLNYWYAIKGVVGSVFIYTLVVVVLKFS